MKKAPGDIISNKCTKNHDHICYTVPEIWCMTNVIVIFHFGLFFVFFALLPPPPPSTAQKIKLKKNKDKNNEQKHKGENILQCIQERLKVRK